MSLQWAGRLSLFLLLLLVDLDARKAHSEFPVPDLPDFYEGLEEAAWALTKTNVVLNSTNGSISWNSDPGEAISNVARIYLVIPPDSPVLATPFVDRDACAGRVR